MKTILKHGFKSYMQATCPYCGCIFTYEWSDVIYPRDYWSYEQNKLIWDYNDYSIICPDCYKDFKIPSTWTIPNYQGIKITCTCNSEGCEKHEKD